MKYKRGEIAKILDIPIDSLRFYEKKGICKPTKNPENNYRYYSEWDIYDLLEYQRFRSLEFTVSEVIQITKSDSLKRHILRFEESCNYFNERAIYYQRLHRHALHYQKLLQEIQEKIWDCDLVEYSGYYYVLQTEQKSLKSSFFKEWDQFYSFVNGIICIDVADIQKNSNTEINKRWFDIEKDQTVETEKYKWGIAFDKRLAEECKLTFEVDVKLTEPGLALRTIICAGSKGNFSYDLLNIAFDYIEKNNYIITGDIIGNFIVRTNEEDGYKRYIEVWIPVKKEND